MIHNIPIEFPDVNTTDDDGLLAIGGDLSAEQLILAYKKGVFPWFEDGDPIMWWSPNPRFVLFPEQLKISKSTRQAIKKNDFKITFNTEFYSVINKSAKIKRVGQSSSWITNSMIEAYVKLHQLGFTKSVEVWKNNNLVGGFYGVDLGNGVFCGESMFSTVSNASKIGFITFIQNTKYKLIDCQIHTDYLESLGGENISRNAFLKYLF